MTPGVSSEAIRLGNPRHLVCLLKLLDSVIHDTCCVFWSCYTW